MEDDNTCNGDGGGNGFGVEDSQWTLQAVDNQDSNNSRRQFVGDFFKESAKWNVLYSLRQLLSSFGLCKGCDK